MFQERTKRSNCCMRWSINFICAKNMEYLTDGDRQEWKGADLRRYGAKRTMEYSAPIPQCNEGCRGAPTFKKNNSKWTNDI